MRLVALFGLLICSLAAILHAAGDDADRFLETAKKLIQAINSDDSPAIQASFDAQMQQFLPPDKATPFFRGLVSAKGKLKEAGAPQVTGPTAIVRVTAERGAWDFKISLNPSGKIAGLFITEAAAGASAPASAQRFNKVANKLIQAINSDDSAAIQSSLDAQMQQAFPPDKTTPFFRGLVSAAGKMKDAGVPQVTGPTAIVRVSAERGAWDFKITLDASDKISGLTVTPPGSGSGPSLYVLSIGINDYPDKRLKLDCAAPDARDIRQAFLTHSRRQFPGGVQTRLLLDGQATRANILEGLQWLASKVKGNDVAVVFYAGHGDSQIEGQFYLVPFDANLRKLGASGISGAALRKALGDLPSTTMLILDACDSGAFDPKAPKTRKVRALPTATDTMLRQMVNDEGLVVMCGAAKGSYAIEENGHGFFTRAIVDGLSGKADVYKKGRVDLIDLQGYVVNRVTELSSGDQEPTISIPSTIRSFPLAKP